MKNWKILKDLPAEVVITALNILKSVVFVANLSKLAVDSLHYYGRIESSKVYIAVVETMMQMKFEVGARIASSWFGLN